MTIKQTLEKLAAVQEEACVTISLNTHRTHPDNAKDAIVVKNLLKEAKDRVISEFEKRPASSLLENLEAVETEIDNNHNLESMHIFISNDIKEVVKSTWPVPADTVHISNSFAIRPLIKAYNRSEEYILLVVSQSGVNAYEALNDSVRYEFKNDDFPFSESGFYNTHHDKGSDAKHVDDLVREFLNRVDKAVGKIVEQTGLHCVVLCTEDNYSRLMQVADKPSVYHGYAAIDYNKMAPHQIVQQSWEMIKELQSTRRTTAIGEMKEAVAHGKVLTDLQEIFQAATDGRGDLLIVQQNFAQPVQMTGERNFEWVTDASMPGVIDDITSTIAWEVLSKNGRVIFTSQEDLSELGEIVLKTRY